MRQNLISEKWCWDIDDFLDAFLLAPPFPHGNLFLNSLKPERAPSNLVKIKTNKKPFTFLGFFIMFLLCFFLPDSLGYYGVLYVDEAILEPIGKCLHLPRVLALRACAITVRLKLDFLCWVLVTFAKGNIPFSYMSILSQSQELEIQEKGFM